MSRLSGKDKERIFSYDAAMRPGRHRRTLRSIYLKPCADDGLEIFVVAVRLRKESDSPEMRIIARHNPAKKRFSCCVSVRFLGIAGWRVNWGVESELEQLEWVWRSGLNFASVPVINPEALAETKYRYCGWKPQHATMCGLVDFLHLWERDRRVEVLAKARLWNLVSPGGIKRLATDPELLALVKQHDAMNYALREFVFARCHGVSLDAAREHFDAIAGFAGAHLPKAFGQHRVKILRWCRKWKILPTDYARYAESVLTLGWDVSAEHVLFPSPKGFRALLERVETDAAKAIKRVKARELKAALREVFDRYGGVNALTMDDLTARVPETAAEFNKEGKAMRNCIGENGFAAKQARGESLCVFVRKGGKPWADMEIDLRGNGVALRQLYGKRNSPPESKVQDFAKNVLKAVRKCARNRFAAERKVAR